MDANNVDTKNKGTSLIKLIKTAMTSKRSRLQMYLDVLQVIKKGIQKPTLVMYKCNLSWKPLKEILESLIVQGLIVMREEGSRKRYEITEKGKDVLGYFSTARELMVVEAIRKTIKWHS